EEAAPLIIRYMGRVLEAGEEVPRPAAPSAGRRGKATAQSERPSPRSKKPSPTPTAGAPALATPQKVQEGPALVRGRERSRRAGEEDRETGRKQGGRASAAMEEEEQASGKKGGRKGSSKSPSGKSTTRSPGKG
ncbi:MAG: hypothetical protein ACPL7G_03825, partial [Chloroflexia bacterium]